MADGLGSRAGSCSGSNGCGSQAGAVEGKNMIIRVEEIAFCPMDDSLMCAYLAT
jgi:hypothetical protein